MADGRYFAKSVRSPFRCNLLTDLMKFGATMHIALLQRTDRSDFELMKSKMAAAAILKITTKSRYLRNGLTDLSEIW